MASCLFSFLLFVSLFPSIPAAVPTGLKVRVTDRAEDILKAFGLTFLDELLNKPFPDILVPVTQSINFNIKGSTFTHLSVNPHQAILRFQGGGVKIEIRDMNFAGNFQRDVKAYLLSLKGAGTFEGAGVSATIGLDLNRNQNGHLSVQMSDCRFQADQISVNLGGPLGVAVKTYDYFKSLFRGLFNNQLCPFIETYAMPKINTMLESLTMVMKVNEDRDINIDYSLSGNIAVTPHTLDIPFKGLVFRQGQNVDILFTSERKGTDLVFYDTDRMAFLGVSEFFFNSIGVVLYQSGTFHFERPELTKLQKWGLSLAGIEFPLDVTFTEAPIISISPDGLSINVNALAQPLAKTKPVPLTCEGNVKIGINNRHLVFPSNNIKCKLRPTTVRGKAVKPVNNGLKTFIQDLLDKGILIPLPDGVDFTQGKIDYYNGYLVIGGNLGMTRVAREKVVKGFGR
ncbi:phospholipid transfer protein isoform X2 [Lates calcarifer]|uniref:Bactericidal permeability-increasing protein n=1 Tax=Lates calcarifer TaxID=8187 RepID=A0AAJ8B254_LATCA|nr:phospholipid transfer protein isoform X2 [Lates calcarifer]